MSYSNKEDRLNPIAPEGVDEGTLGGYSAVHGRAVAFEASDGSAYTGAVEVERPQSVGGRWSAYLVFVRWADGGTAIMGHVETEDLASGATEAEARGTLEALRLTEVKEILEQELARRAERGDPPAPGVQGWRGG